MILAGDIGGTNTRLALFDEKFSKRHERNFRNEGRGGLVEIVREFIGGVGGAGAKPGASDPGPSITGAGAAGGDEKIDRATFGVAGPVKEGRASMTNLPWKLDERELAAELKIEKVALINDLVAHGEGIELLRPEELIVVQAGEPAGGRRATAR